MSIPVLMPALGESVNEGTVTRWLKSAGDQVTRDEPIVEVSTDKVDTEIPAPASGVLAAIVVGEDHVVQVGAILARIAVPDAAAPADLPGPKQSEETVPFTPVPASDDPSPHLDQIPPPPPPTPVWLPVPDDPAGQAQPDSVQAPVNPVARASVTDGLGQLPAGSGDWLTGSGDWLTGSGPVKTPPAGTPGPASIPRRGDWSTGTGPASASIDMVTSPTVRAPRTQPEERSMAYVTPLVRKLADELRVDLETVKGSGVGGRIRREDIEAEAARLEAARLEAARREAERQAAEAARREAERQAAETARREAERQAAEVAQREAERQAAQAAEEARASTERQTPPVSAAATSRRVSSPAEAPRTPTSDGREGPATGGADAFGGVLAAAASQPLPAPLGQVAIETLGRPDVRRGTVASLSWQRSAMAERMVTSLRSTAQVTATAEVDVTRVSRLLDASKGRFAERHGVELTFLPFFMLATVEALGANPTLNASLDGDQIRYHDPENIAFTVDTALGPVTPVIKDAGSAGLVGLALAIDDLARRIRDNAIMPDELAGGTFTITNPGTGDALFETPLVPEPQVGILSFGAIVKRPVVITDAGGNDAIAVRSMAYLALSYDHRLVDGPDAGRFLSAVRRRIEAGRFEADLA
jgi:2-oxoglutarate dehydrogenase E2 component (dihydrolipoamide succinyltransferase)